MAGRARTMRVPKGLRVLRHAALRVSRLASGDDAEDLTRVVALSQLARDRRRAPSSLDS